MATRARVQDPDRIERHTDVRKMEARGKGSKVSSKGAIQVSVREEGERRRRRRRRRLSDVGTEWEIERAKANLQCGHLAVRADVQDPDCSQ